MGRLDCRQSAEVQHMPSIFAQNKSMLNNIFTGRESERLNDEETALFSTIQEVSRQVYREASEMSLVHKEEYAAVTNAPVNKTPAKTDTITAVKEAAAKTEVKPAGRTGSIIEKCDDLIEDELKVASDIIDRNRAVTLRMIAAQTE